MSIIPDDLMEKFKNVKSIDDVFATAKSLGIDIDAEKAGEILKKVTGGKASGDILGGITGLFGGKDK